MSIIPGIETGAPERTESSSGARPAAEACGPPRTSSSATAAETSSANPSGSAPVALNTGTPRWR